MLEKMGWKMGQGIGRNNQGISENIKIRLKVDCKGNNDYIFINIFHLLNKYKHEFLQD